MAMPKVLKYPRVLTVFFVSSSMNNQDAVLLIRADRHFYSIFPVKVNVKVTNPPSHMV